MSEDDRPEQGEVLIDPTSDGTPESAPGGSESEIDPRRSRADQNPESAPGGSESEIDPRRSRAESDSEATEGATGLSEEPPDPKVVAETAAEFVRGLTETLGLTADVTPSTEGDTARLDVAGEEMGSLIGRRGQTLDALQELTRTAVQRRLRARIRLLVDVEGYRARRRDSLAEYARSMAQRAIERGTEIELEPMNAYERKIVHDAVADIAGASSFSEGEEPYRKVIVRGD